MAWTKLKNIIIFILLATNLCLLAFTAYRGSQNRSQQAQARAEIISFLQKQGIRVDEEQVPSAVTLLPQQVSRNVEEECVLAAALLEGEVFAEARGGEVYRYYNDKGSVQFHSNGDFSAQFTPGLEAGEADLEEHALSVLRRISFSGRVTARERTEGGEMLTVQQLWQGAPVLSCQAVLRYRDGRLAAITGGRRLTGEPVEESGSAPITAATALMRFYTGMNALGDVCSEISGITQAYAVASTVSGPMPLVPVWCITTDTGSYQLDTLTGALSRSA